MLKIIIGNGQVVCLRLFEKFANLYDEKWQAIVASESDHREKFLNCHVLRN